MNILVSACLFGANCKYSGGNNFSQKIYDLKDNHTLILVCPEQLGGLDTPRPPAEIQQSSPLQILTKEGADVTAAFVKGADLTLKIAQLHECNLAILKANSPSCGTKRVYDGTFSHNLTDGVGVTAKLLIENNIQTISECDPIESIIQKIKSES